MCKSHNRPLCANLIKYNADLQSYLRTSPKWFKERLLLKPNGANSSGLSFVHPQYSQRDERMDTSASDKHFVRRIHSPRYLPLTKDQPTVLWCYLGCSHEQTVEQTVELLVTCDAMTLIWHQCYVKSVVDMSVLFVKIYIWCWPHCLWRRHFIVDST